MKIEYLHKLSKYNLDLWKAELSSQGGFDIVAFCFEVLYSFNEADVIYQYFSFFD